MKVDKWFVGSVVRFLKAVIALSLGGSIIVVLVFEVATAGNQIIALGVIVLGGGVFWILSIHRFYATYSLQRGSYEHRQASSPLADDLQPWEEIFRVSVIERLTRKILTDSGLVFHGVFGEGIPPRLIRVATQDFRHPTYMAYLNGDLSLTNFEDSIEMLEAGFRCPIELSSYRDLPDTVQLRFCFPGSSIRLYQPPVFWAFVLSIGNRLSS